MHKNIDNSKCFICASYKKIKRLLLYCCSTSLALHQSWKTVVKNEVVIVTIWSASFSWRSAAAVSDSISYTDESPHVDLETWPGVISAN